MIRCFMAVELSHECRRALGKAIETLSELRLPIRWVKPENLHVTLKFLGDVPEKDIPAVTEAMRAAGAGVPPFTVSVRGLGGFPQGRRPRVVFADIEDKGHLLERLFNRIEAGLAERLGFPKEERPFACHITLGRAKRAPVNLTPEQMAGRLKTVDFGGSEVRECVLMSSEPRPEGPVYTAMARAKLGGG